MSRDRGSAADSAKDNVQKWLNWGVPNILTIRRADFEKPFSWRHQCSSVTGLIIVQETQCNLVSDNQTRPSFALVDISRSDLCKWILLHQITATLNGNELILLSVGEIRCQRDLWAEILEVFHRKRDITSAWIPRSEKVNAAIKRVGMMLMRADNSHCSCQFQGWRCWDLRKDRRLTPGERALKWKTLERVDALISVVTHEAEPKACAASHPVRCRTLVTESWLSRWLMAIFISAMITPPQTHWTLNNSQRCRDKAAKLPVSDKSSTEPQSLWQKPANEFQTCQPFQTENVRPTLQYKGPNGLNQAAGGSGDDTEEVCVAVV